MRAIFGLAALLVSVAAQAADVWAVASLRSYHVERKGYNERNLGLGAEVGIARDTRAVAGFYRNSFDNTSTYAAIAHAPLRLGPVRIGGFAGIATGYKEKTVGLAAAAVASVEGERAGMNVGFLPASGGVFFLQLKWKLK